MLLRLITIPLLISATACACLNTPGTDLDGHKTSGLGRHEAASLRRLMAMTSPAKARPYVSKPPATAAKRLEAEALELIYAGHYPGAVPLLQKAEETAPGDYSIAANLGTAHELVGNNTEALRWITEAMRRYPDSHRGTEWVHVLLLKAKLEDAATPDAAARRPLLNVPRRVTPTTPILVEGATRTAEQVRDAISYQLHERLVFVKPKDRYVAELLFTLARLNASLVSIESAADLLTLAEIYGYADPEKTFSLHADITRARRKATLLEVAYWTVGLGAFGATLTLAYRRKWIFLTRAAYLAHRARRAKIGV